MSQDDDYKFFEEQRESLIKEHKDEYVVIKDRKILKFYQTDDIALTETLKYYKLGEFIVQHCIPADQDVYEFRSRVMFSNS